MEAQDEKRKYARLNTLVDIVYNKRVVSEEENLMLAKNISMGGICIISYEELKPQEALDLEVYLPEDKKPIKVLGRVAWIKEFVIGDPLKGKRYDVGVEFVRISDENREKINKYVFKYL